MDLYNETMLQLSSDDMLTTLTDKDSSVEIVGYVQEILRPQEVGQFKKHQLFKFVLATGGVKKIICLIWGNELIDKYQHEITSRRILHIDGAYCKATILNSARIADNFVSFELIIQKCTVVNYLGNYGQQVIQEVVPTSVDFNNIHHADGLITIKGYIKMKFVSVTNRFDNATYGSGSITDGERKLNVNITKFSPISFEKGTAVIVTGEVNDKTGFISVACKDSSDIILNPDINTKMLSSVLIRGVRTPKREHPTV